MATQISLAFFVYMVGMSWSLLAFICFEIHYKPRELLENLLMWPLMWLLVGAVLFSMLIDWGIETAMDFGGYIQRLLTKDD